MTRCLAFAAGFCLLAAATAGAREFGFALEARWRAPAGPVRALAFDPAGGRLVAAAGRQGVVFALDAGGPRNAGTLAGLRKGARGVAVSPEGGLIAAVDGGGALRLYEAESLRPLAAIEGAHPRSALAVGFTADGRYLLSGGEKGEVKVWTVEGGFHAALERGAEHEAGVVLVAGVGPGRRALTVGRDRRLILWNVDTQRAERPGMVDMEVRSAAVGGGGKILALGLRRLSGNLRRSVVVISAHETETVDVVRLVDTATGTLLRDLEGGDQNLDAVAVSPDGRFVAAAGSAAFASVWEAASGRLVTQMPLPDPATALTFSPDGAWLAAGTEGGGLALYRLTGVGPAPAVPEAPGERILIVIIEPEMVILGRDGAGGQVPRVRGRSLLVRGRIKAPAPLRSLQVNGREITSLQPTAEGDLLFTAPVPLPEPGRATVEIVAEDQSGASGHKSFVVERAPEVEPPDPGGGRRLALIVGVARYADTSIDLDYADDDARALYDLLVSPALGPAAFHPRDVRLLLNEEATVAEINVGLRQFLQRATENDFVLFYFAGHGLPDPGRLSDLYLMAHDSDPRNVAGTGLLMRHVREAIAQIRARDVLILTDACHSAGMAAPGSIRSLAVNPIHDAFLEKMRHSSGGLAILTASEAAQVSLEGPQWAEHGAFTYFLLKGMRGAADGDGDRIVALGEVMEYVRENVKRETAGRQIPAIGPTSFDRQQPLVVVPRREP